LIIPPPLTGEGEGEKDIPHPNLPSKWGRAFKKIKVPPPFMGGGEGEGEKDIPHPNLPSK